MTSRPKMAARDRMLAFGVEGREGFPVENLNNPYCWTADEREDDQKLFQPRCPRLTCLHDATRDALRLYNVLFAIIRRVARCDDEL